MKNININFFIERLRELNIKVTPERHKILEVFTREPYKHFTSKEIFEFFKSSNINLGLATIYRNLNLFESLNIINKLTLENGTAKYEFNNGKFKNQNFHFHLICVKCGKIIDYNYEEINKLYPIIEKDLDFKIENMDGKFYGYCNACKKEALYGD